MLASWYLAGVRRRFLKWLVVWPLILLVGGQWALLQSVAWTTMLVRFSQAMSLAQAAEFTFDGQHLCALCKAVKAGQNAERKESRFKPPEPLLLGLCPEPPLLPPPPLAKADFSARFTSASFTAQPPHPPPRGV